MRQKYFLTVFLSVIALYPITSYGLTVIQASPQAQARAQAQEQAWRDAGRSIGTACRRASDAREAEKQRIIDTRNQIYIYEMLRDYTPEKHDEFVACITVSALPEHQKMIVICEFNDRNLKWKKEKDNTLN